MGDVLGCLRHILSCGIRRPLADAIALLHEVVVSLHAVPHIRLAPPDRFQLQGQRGRDAGTPESRRIHAILPCFRKAGRQDDTDWECVAGLKVKLTRSRRRLGDS